MREMVLTLEKMPKEKTSAQSKRWTAIFVLSGFAALLLIAAGLFISVLHVFHLFEKDYIVNRIGTFMIIASFPLGMLCAHSMDKLREFQR